MKKQYSVNVTKENDIKFKRFLQANNIRYYSQGCYNEVNFQLELNSVQAILIDNFLDTLN